MDSIIDLLGRTAEAQGWDALSTRVGTYGTLVFAMLEVWGLRDQQKKIREAQSATSISIYWMIAGLFVFWSFFLYGLFTLSIVSTINGLLTGAMHVPIIYLLFKYEGFNWRHWLVFFLMSFSLPIMLFVPDKQVAFGIVSVVLVVMVATQSYELLREGSTGQSSFKMLSVYCLSASFWMVYGFAIDDVLLQIVCTSNFFLIAFAAFLWLFFWHRDRSIL